MERIKIGVVQKPHGVRGEIKIFPTTDFIKERFKKDNVVTMILNGKTSELTIESSRMHKQSVLVKFKEHSSLNDVEFFHNAELYVNRDELHALPEDEFYFVDLVGCKAFVSDKEIGEVIEVMETPAHPILRIKAKDEDRDILVPFVERFIVSVDVEAKQIEIDWMEGL